MFESLNSPNIHTPANLAEYANTITHYPDATLWAFGSAIMDSPNFYPSNNMNVEIIYLGAIEELYKFQRNDRAVEFGSMVNLNEILSSARTVLPQVLIDTLKSIASHTIRNRVSLGGAIANMKHTSALIGTLYILNCQLEIRYLKKKRLHYHFFPIAKLVEKTGELTLPPSSLISRIRIGISNYNYQHFNSIEDPILNRSQSVSIVFVSNFEQITTQNARLAITYPDQGFFSNRETDSLLNNIQLPLDPATQNELISKILDQIRMEYDINQIQQYRTRKLIENLLNNLNYTIMTMNHD